MPAEASPRAHGERMADYVSAEDRQALPSIVAEVERRLADVPRGQSHGDFWSENFLVRDGRLDTVLPPVMKDAPQAVGTQLRGASIRVTDSLYWIALSNNQADQNSNLELLGGRQVRLALSPGDAVAARIEQVATGRHERRQFARDQAQAAHRRRHLRLFQPSAAELEQHGR